MRHHGPIAVCTMMGVAAIVCSLAACNRTTRSEQIVGGCSYTEMQGHCSLTSTEVIAANSDDPSLVGIRLTYRWVGDPPRDLPEPLKTIEWQVPRSRLDAARAHAAANATVACSYAAPNGPCPPYLSIQPSALPPPPEPAARSRDAICPPKQRTPLNPTIAGTGPAALIAAFPTLIDHTKVVATADWHRESADAAPAGTAGSWADQASAVYGNGRARVRVVIDDMIRVCTGMTGASDTLLDTEEAIDPGASRRRTNVGSRSAVFVEWKDPSGRRRLILWIADRCRVALEPDGKASPEELTQVASGLDLSSLEKACARR